MRIVQTANFYHPKSGGLRTAMHQLAVGYQRAGHESVLIVPGAQHADEMTPFGRRISMAAPKLPGSGGYRVITDIDRLIMTLDELSPDRLEVSDRTTMRPLGWWARGAGIPSCVWAHERLDGVFRTFSRGLLPSRLMADRWNRVTAAKFDTVIASTFFAGGEFERIDLPYVRVPLGVDLQTFHPDRNRPALRDDLVHDHSEILLVMCTRLSKEKCPDIGIEVVREMGARGVKVRLVILGDGPERRRLERMVADVPVRLLGHVSDRWEVAALLATADVLIAPGPIETFGLAALEALACGTPVVANRSGALAEVIGERGGAAVDPTAGAFADAVLAVMANTNRRADARSRAEEFPWSQTVARMLALHGDTQLSAHEVDR